MSCRQNSTQQSLWVGAGRGCLRRAVTGHRDDRRGETRRSRPRRRAGETTGRRARHRRPVADGRGVSLSLRLAVTLTAGSHSLSRARVRSQCVSGSRGGRTRTCHPLQKPGRRSVRCGGDSDAVDIIRALWQSVSDWQASQTACEQRTQATRGHDTPERQHLPAAAAAAPVTVVSVVAALAALVTPVIGVEAGPARRRRATEAHHVPAAAATAAAAARAGAVALTAVGKLHHHTVSAHTAGMEKRSGQQCTCARQICEKIISYLSLSFSYPDHFHPPPPLTLFSLLLTLFSGYPGFTTI